MTLFGHHAKAILDIEVMGYELTPDTATEHAVALGIVVVVLALMGYGAFALVRDFLRWRRPAGSR